MLRGTTFFHCQTCGNVFEGMDIEDRMTAGTIPQPYPKCVAQCLQKKGGLIGRLFGLL